VRVCVSDEGAGVAPDFVPHLFHRSTRGGTVRAQGAGLGLSVVEDLVRAHGGVVGYEAETRSFFFTLPAAPERPVAGPSPEVSMTGVGAVAAS
jgi:signal transduction histidine kinase